MACLLYVLSLLFFLVCSSNSNSILGLKWHSFFHLFFILTPVSVILCYSPLFCVTIMCHLIINPVSVCLKYMHLCDTSLLYKLYKPVFNRERVKKCQLKRLSVQRQ